MMMCRPVVKRAIVVGLAGWIVGSSFTSGAATHSAETLSQLVYTREQAKRGESEYMKACASCHLDDLSGQHTTPPLAGETFIQNYDGRSVGDLFERMRTTMPQNAVGSLSDQAYVDIVAFVLQANRFPSGSQPLPPSPDQLKTIVIRAPQTK